MCLPVGLLKCFISFEAIIVLLIGLSSLSGTIYIDVNHSLYFGTLNDVVGSNPEQGIITALYVISSLLILFGFSGIVGGWKKIGTLLFCFNIGNFFMAIAFGVVGIMGFLIANNEIFDLQNCANSGVFKDSSTLNNAYKDAENYFCKTNGCQCYYNQTIKTDQVQAVQYYSSSNSQLPVRIQDCPNYSAGDWNITLLAEIEADYTCSGWCEAYPIYLLTNVNFGYPDQSCYYAIWNYAQSICVTIGAVAISVFCVMVICITCVLCLCCHPTKKQQGNFYSRMAYYDE